MLFKKSGRAKRCLLGLAGLLNSIIGLNIKNMQSTFTWLQLVNSLTTIARYKGRGCQVGRTALFASPTGAAVLCVCLGSIVSSARGFEGCGAKGWRGKGVRGCRMLWGPFRVNQALLVCPFCPGSFGGFRVGRH